jgi:hypothetical protein
MFDWNDLRFLLAVAHELRDGGAKLTRIWRIVTLPPSRRVPRVAALVDETDALRPILTG